MFFTEEGILPVKGTVELEVTHIVEIIKARNNPQSTNNEAELLATISALQHAVTVEGIKSVTVYTDSNYIVSSYNENLEKWKKNGWQRLDGKVIVHIKEWEQIDQHAKTLASHGCILKIVWVKGHSDSYGNGIADTYSVIGSNSSKLQFENPTEPFVETVLDQCITFEAFKKSFAEKDFIYFFRDLYFSSNDTNDTNYCFLTTSENPLTVGRRSSESIFVANTGYVPPLIQSIKKLYRSLPRNYTTTCCIKLAKLDNKDFFRLTNYIDISLLVVKANHTTSNVYTIINDSTPFLLENRADFPFIVSASNLFNKMVDLETTMATDNNGLYIYDITDKMVANKKLVLTNKDKIIDFSDTVKDELTFKQKPFAVIGYDIPNFLALKNIEQDIDKVLMVVETSTETNFCTIYYNFVTNRRNIYTVNIENKYLRIK